MNTVVAFMIVLEACVVEHGSSHIFSFTFLFYFFLVSRLLNVLIYTLLTVLAREISDTWELLTGYRTHTRRARHGNRWPSKVGMLLRSFSVLLVESLYIF